MIDPRGPRLAAWITTFVLAAVVLSHSGVLLLAQALVFVLGTRGRSPYALLFRRLVRPRLGPPAELEPEAPTRFAQLVGAVFAGIGVVGLATGLTWLGLAATVAALAAAFLNAAFGFCLGCQLYLLVKQATTPATTPATTKGATT